MSEQTKEWLDVLARILLRCTVLGFAFLLVWFAAYLLASDMIRWQGGWFDLTGHELDLIHYCGIGFVKSCVLLFFLFPYLSIRMVLRK